MTSWIPAWMCFVALACLSLGVALGAQAPAGKPAAPEVRIVESLLGSPHGLDVSRNPEAGRLMELIRKDPAPYIPLLGTRLVPATIADGDEESVRQAAIAAALLVQVCAEAGRSLAARQMDALQAQSVQISAALARPAARDEKSRLADIARAQRADRLISVARIIVAEFAAARDPRLRDGLITRFPTDDYVTQLTSLSYFETATPADPRVQALLRAEYESRKSAFYRSPRVRALIDPPKPGAQPR